jgi:DNA repair exonuclease SbcCD ATPase subunit
MFKELKDAISRLKDRFNDSLKKLPVIEQVQNAEQVGSAMQRIEWAADSLREFFQGLEDKAAELEQRYTADVEQAVTQKVEELKVTYIELADHEAKLQAAEAAKETELQTAMQTLRENFSKVGARRAELGDKLKSLPSAAGVLQSIADDFFLAEDYAAVQTAMVERVKKLHDAGITAERPVAKAFKFTVAQSGEFDEWLEDMAAVKSLKAGVPGIAGGGDFKPGLDTRQGAVAGIDRVGKSKQPVAI